jgi:tripartite-type tricarboxylate transporter receptor subunit TctC
VLATSLASVTCASYIVENRPGANTALAADVVAGDGHLHEPVVAEAGALPGHRPCPVVHISNGQYVLIVNGTSEIRSAADLDGRAKSSHGLTCAAAPGPMAVACQQLQARLPGNPIVVPYIGIPPAVAAVLGGHVDVMFVNVESVEAMMKNGTVRAIAASAPSAAEGVPLIGQLWPGLYLDGFTGMLVPAATPTDKVRALNHAFNEALAQPAVRQFMRETRQEIVGGTPEQFARRIATASERYRDLIVKAKLATDLPASGSAPRRP